jgi:hypothetical protein
MFPTSWIIFSHLCRLSRTGASGIEHFTHKVADNCRFLLNFTDSITFEGLSSCLNSASRLHICFSLKIVADLSPLKSQRDAATAYLRRMGCEQFV